MSIVVAYLSKKRIMRPEKLSLLGNVCVTLNNLLTVRSGVFCAVRIGSNCHYGSLEMAVRRVRDLFEMAASLRGREPGNKGSSTIVKRYHTEQRRSRLSTLLLCEIMIYVKCSHGFLRVQKIRLPFQTPSIVTQMRDIFHLDK
jgi:hypothetical protein